MERTTLTYLDHNATTPLRPEARAAMLAALEGPGNPSSVHRAGRLARRRVEDARGQVADLAGYAAEAVIFTSGGTEANALALNGAMLSGRPVERVLVSAIEHPSVLRARPDAETVPVGPDGRVDLLALDALLTGDRRSTLVSVMAANNETGIIQPLAEVAEVARRHGALLHCDAVQAFGRFSLDFGALAVDFVSLSAHKIGGPAGVGALAFGKPGSLQAGLRGGGQEKGLRAGTENIAGIAAFGAAAEAVRSDRARTAVTAAWRDRIDAAVLAAGKGANGGGTVVIGKGVERLVNTTYVCMPGLPAETQVMAFDLAGVAISAGSACSSGRVEPSPVLAAMGVAPDIAGCGIRVSLGWSTTEADVERFLVVWSDIRARAMAGKAESARPAAGLAV
ncbi:MAG: cysteine desulfurase family protein [Rhodospirillales bacterium]